MRIEGIECPDCGPVDMNADQFSTPNQLYPTMVIPISGVCPLCGDRLNWNAGDVLWPIVMPVGHVEGEVPIMEIKITPSNRSEP